MRSSITVNMPISTAAPASSAMVSGAAHPWVPATVKPYTRRNSAPVTVTAPGRSYPVLVSPRLSRTTRLAATAASKCDGHVDEQGPAPRRQLRQRATQHEADGRPPTGDGAVDTEGPGTLTRLGERDGEQRQGSRRHHRGEGALQRPGPEEHGRVLGQAGQGRRRAEAQEAEDEHAAASEVVRYAPPQEQEAPEGQGVGAHDPLPVGDRDVQGALGGRQGNDDDRRVEHDHELGHGDDRQGPVPPGVGSFGLLCDGPHHLGGGHWAPLWRCSGVCVPGAQLVGRGSGPVPEAAVLAVGTEQDYNRSEGSVSTGTIRSVRSVCQSDVGGPAS